MPHTVVFADSDPNQHCHFVHSDTVTVTARALLNAGSHTDSEIQLSDVSQTQKA